METMILRNLLAVYILMAFGLTLFYLRYRRCSALEFAIWATLALVLPVFGPFFVIAARPGPRKRIKRPGAANRVLPLSERIS
jgi:hypothetical protein